MISKYIFKLDAILSVSLYQLRYVEVFLIFFIFIILFYIALSLI